MKFPPYDLFPCVTVSEAASACVTGWSAIAGRLSARVAERAERKTVVVVECYHGIDEAQVLAELTARLQPALALAAREALRPVAEVEALVAPFVGDDPVFGQMNALTLADFFCPTRMAASRQAIAQVSTGMILVVGCGATLIADADILVYADLSRREAQLRQRRGDTGNLGAANHGAAPSLLYKRAFYVDWRVCDRHKQPLIVRWDFILDTHEALKPKLADGEAVRRGLRETAQQPFRVVPYFDPAPWGGQWLREHFALDAAAPNYGWGFDCVPEENSLRLAFGATQIELPAQDLVLFQPVPLLGAKVFQRFGSEFPIRFDFLDTMDGGNLSFQVHPLTAYIRKQFGMAYTQDESYYLLAARPGASVYLGLREGVEPAAMMAALAAAQAGGAPFPTENFAAAWPAKAHDHFLIPAGTVHCSGRECVVLEISATPYLFTFKLWDWNRAGLDGKPRPIHLDHGEKNIQWDRTANWVAKNLVSPITPLASGDGWREERTGLDATQFIETRRHWFTSPVPHHTEGNLNVLNLVQGDAAIVESPDNAFAPFRVHYAETFIVPAAVGPYLVRPADPTSSEPCATIKAFVRS
ncbi:class I mannose-6-phosphate isomerase [Oleiharenicola lentus]|uniref:class I mannose-6-phosphate isomerase n=1 Tax=Oleiharenicola lentus TaxID=2508720 RepID=UPI003F66F062